MRKAMMLAAAMVLSGCANHPMDCAVGVLHADCLPGTAGYLDVEKKYGAADDTACKAQEGDYAACRAKLAQEHRTGFFDRIEP